MPFERPSLFCVDHRKHRLSGVGQTVPPIHRGYQYRDPEGLNRSHALCLSTCNCGGSRAGPRTQKFKMHLVVQPCSRVLVLRLDGFDDLWKEAVTDTLHVPFVVVFREGVFPNAAHFELERAR